MKRAAWQRVLLSAWVRPVLLVALLLVAWDLAIRLFRIPPYLIPSPWSVVQQLFNEWPRLLKESIPTTYATLGGFALSIAFGIPMALMIAYSRTIESFVYPLLVFSQSVPKIAIAPLFVVWFGFGIIPKVIAAFMLGFFPIVVSTVMGFKSVDPDMLVDSHPGLGQLVEGVQLIRVQLDQVVGVDLTLANGVAVRAEPVHGPLEQAWDPHEVE